MSPKGKSIAAAVVAVAMVVAAVIGRNALDRKEVRNDLRFTVVCDPLAEPFCRAAADADSRLTIRVEAPDKTTKVLVDLAPGASPDFQVWVSVGPWLQMADGRRKGQPPLRTDVRFLASSALVLITRPDQKLPLCAKRAPAACLPLPGLSTGLPSPRSSGVGLAGLAQVVLADTGISAAALDRNAIDAGPASDVLDRLGSRTRPNAGREQVNVQFSGANPIVSTQANVSEFGRAQVLKSEPAVRAVLQVGFLDSRAVAPVGGEAAGRALAGAATAAGWEPVGDPTGGLPDPGVLAALQDAWRGP